MQTIKLNEIQKDALQELANIGAGHASTALSKMVNKEIQMGIPNVSLIPLEETVGYVESEKVVVGVYLKISEEIPSYVLLLIPRDSSFALANMLMGRPPDTHLRVFSDLDKSAIQELSNVMVCAFFDSISELLNITIVPGPPVLAYDIPVAVMDYVLVQIGEVADKVLVFNVELKEETRDFFKINMFLMPEPQSIETLLEKLGL